MIEAKDGMDDLTMEHNGMMARTMLHLALRLPETAPQQSSLNKDETAVLQ